MVELLIELLFACLAIAIESNDPETRRFGCACFIVLLVLFGMLFVIAVIS